MKTKYGASISAVCAAGLVLTACGVDDEDDYPSSQIEIIVPWAAGGGTDMATRQLANAAEDTCGVGMTITNQTGAAGATGHQAMADANADGYTIGAATVELSILQHLGAAEVSPEDLEGILQFQASPAVLSVPADSEFENVDDLIAALEDGESISVATNGTGGIWDIAAGGLALENDVTFTERVPYDGGPEMAQAAMGGEVQALASTGAEILSQLESGDLRALAVMGEERLDILPDTPTLEEEGYEWTASNWFGLVAPNDVDSEKIAALSECFGEAAESEQFQEFMENQGFPVEIREHEEFGSYMNDQYSDFEVIVDELY